MRFLLDAHVRRDVADFFRYRHHDVYLVQERLAAGAPDPLVVADADQLAAIIVTWNRKHFKPLVSRDPSRKSQQFSHAGLLSCQCKLDNAVPLLQRFIRHIELEFEERQHAADPRVIIELNENGLTTR